MALLVPIASVAQTAPWIGLGANGATLLRKAGVRAELNRFGSALASGDFNNDGHDDLAIGIPGHTCGPDRGCGQVQVRFGWPTGALGAVAILNPANPGSPLPINLSYYGEALAVGDFNRDGYDDLAVGAPQYGQYWDGAVYVHYGLHGNEGSIQWTAEHALRQGDNGMPGSKGVWEEFGRALAAGDFNGDGWDDLAIGAPWNDLGDEGSVGNVTIAHGYIGGLMPVDAFEMWLGDQGLPDAPESGELFGEAIAAGDFNCDAYDDVAIGVPGEDGVGAVLVVYGSPNSLIFANHWYFSQWDLNQTVDFEGAFGAVLAAGDFDGDDCDDLAVGSPGYNGGGDSYVDMGLVAVVYGARAGMSAAGHEFLWEDKLLGAGHSEVRDRFGSAIAAGDFDHDGVDDLAIGAAGDDEWLAGLAVTDAGSVTLVRGERTRGLARARRLHAGDVPGHFIPDELTAGANYGASLVAGDFDSTHGDDLAIGAPYRNDTEGSGIGAVAVIFASPPPASTTALLRDGFEN